jgi:secreted Zn-dependent insulinase-like peptidase
MAFPETGPTGNARNISGHKVYVVDEIVKSDQDKGEYRHLTLPNGLQVLLSSESDLDKVIFQ